MIMIMIITIVCHSNRLEQACVLLLYSVLCIAILNSLQITPLI